MKKNKRVSENKTVSPLLLPEAAHRAPWGNLSQGAVTVWEWRGKEGALAWRIRLPWGEETFPQETRDFFLALGERYLRFLLREGKNGEESRFGGLEFQKTEGGLLFLCSFGPFAQRSLRPCLLVYMKETGEILRLSTRKRELNGSPTLGRSAKGNPKAKGNPPEQGERNPQRRRAGREKSVPSEEAREEGGLRGNASEPR